MHTQPRIRFRLTAALVSVVSMLAALLSLVAGASPAAASGISLSQAVSNLKILPGGTHITVTFHLRYAAMPTVAIRAANDPRPPKETPYVVGRGEPKNDWSLDVTGLQPNTKYPLQISE